MKINLTKFIRQDIADMEEYVPVLSLWDIRKKIRKTSDQFIKLDAGESMYGCSPKVNSALNGFSLYNYYPDPEYKALRNAISEYAYVPIDNIFVSSGSDELLDLLLRLVLNEGDKVINCPPTFGMYSVLTSLNRGKIINITRNPDFSLPIKQIIKETDRTVKVIFVCSPNNPTGTITNRRDIIRLLKTGKLVVVDEAYFEFSGKTVAPLLKQYENLIILRTFSKWAGIAGLRLGYGLMSAYLVKQLLKIKPPYNVNIAADIAGQATLKDTEFRTKTLVSIINERNRMKRELDTLPFLTVYPSDANLLFIKVKNSIEQLQRYLNKKNIIVRYYNSAETGKAIRLSIGNTQQNNSVIAAFKTFYFQQYAFDSLIFDLDGVLIDVSESYRSAVKKSAAYVLRKNFGKNITITSRDVQNIKKVPGFNNDWDVSAALVRLFLNEVKREDFTKNAKKTARNSKLYSLTKDIFQCYYLGSNLYEKVYSKKVPLQVKNGFYKKEILIADLSFLKRLSAKYRLGIATSRPRFEALLALRNANITPGIIKEEHIIAQEDVKYEKPSPDPLLAAKERLGAKNPVYIGDTINDTLAAKRAGMMSIFIGNDAMGDMQIRNFDDLKKFL